MTAYIKNLRKIVGTQPLMQCGATGSNVAANR